MQAPEKINLRKRNKLPLEVVPDKWYETDPQNIYGSVEYTRTDAFIGKACEWLRTHSEADYFELITVANYCGAGTLNKKKMIEDFKKYMKGE